MENNTPVAVETYRSPETKAALKAMTDPRPHKIAASYLKARIRQLLRKKPIEKQALWTRPIDDISYVVKDSVRTAGAAGGADAASRVSPLRSSNPRNAGRGVAVAMTYAVETIADNFNEFTEEYR